MGLQIFGLQEGTTLNDELSFALQIINESNEIYSESALLLFFKGRIQRLQSNLIESINSYETAYIRSSQNEVKLLCLHEIGWCRLIELNFPKAMKHFYELGINSKFSKCFYVYVTLILQGACGNYDNLMRLRTDILHILSRSNTKDAQIEKFIVRRLDKIPKTNKDSKIFENIYWKLLIYEMLYLWNTMTSCPPEAIELIIQDCSMDVINDIQEPMIGLSKLILGSCEITKNNIPEAINAFKNCLEIRNDNSQDDLHISAFCSYELAMLYIQYKRNVCNFFYFNLLSCILNFFINLFSDSPSRST